MNWQSAYAGQLVILAGQNGVRGAIGDTNVRGIVLQAWKERVEDRRKGAQFRGPIDDQNCFQKNGGRST